MEEFFEPMSGSLNNTDTEDYSNSFGSFVRKLFLPTAIADKMKANASVQSAHASQSAESISSMSNKGASFKKALEARNFVISQIFSKWSSSHPNQQFSNADGRSIATSTSKIQVKGVPQVPQIGAGGVAKLLAPMSIDDLSVFALWYVSPNNGLSSAPSFISDMVRTYSSGSTENLGGGMMKGNQKINFSKLF